MSDENLPVKAEPQSVWDTLEELAGSLEFPPAPSKIDVEIGQPKSEPAPYYKLEIDLRCANCGTSARRFTYVGDRAGSYDLEVKACEYCGVFLFRGTLFVRMFDARDAKNIAKRETRMADEANQDRATQAAIDAERDEPKVKVIKGERLE